MINSQERFDAALQILLEYLLSKMETPDEEPHSVNPDPEPVGG